MQNRTCKSLPSNFKFDTDKTVGVKIKLLTKEEQEAKPNNTMQDMKLNAYHIQRILYQ